jgi:hypothetical protein
MIQLKRASAKVVPVLIKIRKIAKSLPVGTFLQIHTPIVAARSADDSNPIAYNMRFCA